MRLVATRKYSFIAVQTLTECQACDSLFKVAENEFVLHMNSDEASEDERLVWLDSRAALLWINQTTDEYGMNWE
ncbi:hypothetical protein MA20_37325 [Bradyrhizobium japonicum]|uniref:Uncharacterized protein n=1 Tax=Bradyrhizobium japonicum TaxID=375 RepID=A0A0A3XP43_BRAJP|nr:hypothetical protein [Bradyrhizobium japonicum]KGT75004.1 hypothetical protein MA20_37325 [Bradyrhizobium japonicum]MCS3895717.1 hypothetical protein [Bradyrhizobium japonicum USDA 38]MCS3948232.1 hypothetical protein [Bradyrhizobium japonicum]